MEEIDQEKDDEKWQQERTSKMDESKGEERKEATIWKVKSERWSKNKAKIRVKKKRGRE